MSFLECKLRVFSEIYPAVETHPTAREASRRKLMKSAKKHMEAGIESQKVRSFRLVLLKKDIQMRSSLLRMPTHSSSITKPCSCLEPRSERSCSSAPPVLSLSSAVCLSVLVQSFTSVSGALGSKCQKLAVALSIHFFHASSFKLIMFWTLPRLACSSMMSYRWPALSVRCLVSRGQSCLCT